MQDWDSLFGHLAPAPDPPKPAAPATANAAAAIPSPEAGGATAEVAAETTRLVDLDGPNSKEHTDQLFWEADLDEDGR